jgi:hypothetical protein
VSARPWRRLNIWLRRRGVRQALLRDVLRFQITVCLAALAAGLILWPLASWMAWIGAGSALSVWNFFSLTKLAPQFMVNRHTLAMGVAFFLRAQGRLAVAAVFLAAAIGWAGAPPWALLTGFTASLAGIVWAMLVFRARRSSS